ncbi:MAG TPA: hypothetical protein VE973_04340 [Candidatus Limnocylindria bacterium]|nr:hypothetical protein [Candidatus Limnocylindria bacterium]
MPDLVSFIPATIYLLFYGTHGASLFSEFAKNQWVFRWAVESYNYTHSLIIFAAIFGIVTLARKGKIYWPMLAWVLHIGIDIFTHKSFFETPFLFPFSNLRNNFAISWSNPIFEVINYGILIFLYVLIFIIAKKHAKKE